MAPAQERHAPHRLIPLDILLEGHCCDILPDFAKLSQDLQGSAVPSCKAMLLCMQGARVGVLNHLYNASVATQNINDIFAQSLALMTQAGEMLLHSIASTKRQEDSNSISA